MLNNLNQTITAANDYTAAEIDKLNKDVNCLKPQVANLNAKTEELEDDVVEIKDKLDCDEINKYAGHIEYIYSSCARLDNVCTQNIAVGKNGITENHANFNTAYINCLDVNDVCLRQTGDFSLNNLNANCLNATSAKVTRLAVGGETGGISSSSTIEAPYVSARDLHSYGDTLLWNVHVRNHLTVPGEMGMYSTKIGTCCACICDLENNNIYSNAGTVENLTTYCLNSPEEHGAYVVYYSEPSGYSLKTLKLQVAGHYIITVVGHDEPVGNLTVDFSGKSANITYSLENPLWFEQAEIVDEVLYLGFTNSIDYLGIHSTTTFDVKAAKHTETFPFTENAMTVANKAGDLVVFDDELKDDTTVGLYSKRVFQTNPSQQACGNFICLSATDSLTVGRTDCSDLNYITMNGQSISVKSDGCHYSGMSVNGINTCGRMVGRELYASDSLTVAGCSEFLTKAPVFKKGAISCEDIISKDENGCTHSLNSTLNSSEVGVTVAPLNDSCKVDLTYLPTGANGVATLDANGKLPLDNLPIEAIVFKGMWNASTNTPTLADGTGTTGDLYIVSEDGEVTFSEGRTIKFVKGDSVIYDGTYWQRKADANLVESVNGKVGAVELTADDINYSDGRTVKCELDCIACNYIAGSCSPFTAQRRNNFQYVNFESLGFTYHHSTSNNTDIYSVNLAGGADWVTCPLCNVTKFCSSIFNPNIEESHLCLKSTYIEADGTLKACNLSISGGCNNVLLDMPSLKVTKAGTSSLYCWDSTSNVYCVCWEANKVEILCPTIVKPIICGMNFGNNICLKFGCKTTCPSETGIALYIGEIYNLCDCCYYSGISSKTDICACNAGGSLSLTAGLVNGSSACNCSVLSLGPYGTACIYPMNVKNCDKGIIGASGMHFGAQAISEPNSDSYGGISIYSDVCTCKSGSYRCNYTCNSYIAFYSGGDSEKICLGVNGETPVFCMVDSDGDDMFCIYGNDEREFCLTDCYGDIAFCSNVDDDGLNICFSNIDGEYMVAYLDDGDMFLSFCDSCCGLKTNTIKTCRLQIGEYIMEIVN